LIDIRRPAVEWSRRDLESETGRDQAEADVDHCRAPDDDVRQILADVEDLEEPGPGVEKGHAIDEQGRSE
jgi:hypothetical protein